jgi:hypothetical protein
MEIETILQWRLEMDESKNCFIIPPSGDNEYLTIKVPTSLKGKSIGRISILPYEKTETGDRCFVDVCCDNFLWL